MARVSVSAPVCRRIYDRLEAQMHAGTYLQNVSKIMLGVPPKDLSGFIVALAEPIVLWCAAYPAGASGGMGAGSLSSNTAYSGLAEIAVFGSTFGSHEEYYRFLDTMDDLLTIVCDVEQRTTWAATSYGESIRLQSNGPVEVEYPQLKVNDIDRHAGILRWPWIANIAWS